MRLVHMLIACAPLGKGAQTEPADVGFAIAAVCVVVRTICRVSQSVSQSVSRRSVCFA